MFKTSGNWGYLIKRPSGRQGVNTLKSIYYVYFHSVIKYGIIFWVNSFISWKLCMLQKIIVRIMAGVQPRTLFKQLEILPVPCQCILSLMSFIISNQEILQINSFIHNINTGNKHHLCRPNANLSCFKKLHSMLA